MPSYKISSIFDTNNLHTISNVSVKYEWYAHGFMNLSIPIYYKKLHIVTWFQVFLSNNNNFWKYSFYPLIET